MNVVLPELHTRFPRSIRKELCLNWSSKVGRWRWESPSWGCCLLSLPSSSIRTAGQHYFILDREQLKKVGFSQGGRWLPLRSFPHFADGRKERFLVWALRQSKEKFVLKTSYVHCFQFDPSQLKITLQPQFRLKFLCMVILLRWFFWPMWLPTEALPPSTLTSMHWRWYQPSTQH